MKSNIILSPSDHHILTQLIENPPPGSRLEPEASAALRDLLGNAELSDDPAVLGDRIGLDHPVSLAAPEDPTDTFDFSIVLPTLENIDEDLLRIGLPVTLAALGRRVGDSLAWQTMVGDRTMVVTQLDRSAVLAKAS